MSVLQYKEGMNSADIQIWNNVAFDNGDPKEFSGNKASWSPLKQILLNSTESLNLDSSSKENEGPLFENPISSVTSSLRSAVTPFKPVNSNGALENSKTRGNTKRSFEEKVDLKSFDEEIEEIEMEIRRLTSRLESLKLEKAEESLKTMEKRGRVIPAKFMEQKQSVKTAEEKKEIEQFSSMSARTGVQRKGLILGPADFVVGARRGMSMGPSEILGSAKSRKLSKQEMTTPVPPIQSKVLSLPAEIVAETRRGMSMGPSEIFGSAKSLKFRKQEMITPVQPIQSRRKSCFWKLQDIDERKEVSKEKRKSSSVSPEPRKTTTKSRVSSRQAVTTVGFKKAVKKEDRMVNSVQPKKLFRDGEKSIPAKPLRAGRVVASRYNQSTNPASEIRKRSLPENGKAENRGDKKRSLSAGKSHVTVIDNKNLGTESRAKKHWEIPNEVVVHSSLVECEKSPQSTTIVLDLLPRIRISRCTKESPRDSGPAKRVVELIGRKSYFCNDEEMEPSVCQVLSFPEEETYFL